MANNKGKTKPAPRPAPRPSTKPSRQKPVATHVPSVARSNDRRVNRLNLASGNNDRVSPVPLSYPVPSNNVTTLIYEPNLVNVGKWADAITQSFISRSNIVGGFDPQLYCNVRAKNVALILEAMSGEPVPSISPISYQAATIFHCYNDIKESLPMPNGIRYKFKVVSNSDGAGVPPPYVSFAGPTFSTDANGFRDLDSFMPGSVDEQNEAYRTVLGSSDVRKWKVGDEKPKLSNGVSQFATLNPGGGHQTFNGQNWIANTFVPLSFPILAGLGLVRFVGNMQGHFNTPIYGSPSVYAGYFCTHHLRNARERVTVIPIEVDDFVPLVIGVMAGINSQAVKAGRPAPFANICPEFLVAQILNCIASSQQKNFPITMCVETFNGKSVRAGTQFPPRDVTSAALNLFYYLVVETMRRYSIISVKAPDESFRGSSARLVIVPAFIVTKNIFNTALGILNYAGISIVSAAGPIEPTLWMNPSTLTPLTYATPNGFSGLPWEVYIADFRNNDDIGQYSKLYPTTQQQEAGLCLTHFFRVFVDAGNARATLDNAILKTAGFKQKRLILLKELVKAPSSSMVSQQLSGASPPFATGTYGLFTPGSVHFLNLPIGHHVIQLDSMGDAIASASAQITSWMQMTETNIPVGYLWYKNLFETGKVNVSSGTKDGTQTELGKLLENRANEGLGGALDDDLVHINRTARAMYKAFGKKPDMKKYDDVAEPTLKLITSLAKPLESKYNYFMG